MNINKLRSKWPERMSDGIKFSKNLIINDNGRCWWRMLETKCAIDKFEMLVTDLMHWKNHQHNDQSRQHNVTNITVSMTRALGLWIPDYLDVLIFYTW